MRTAILLFLPGPIRLIIIIIAAMYLGKLNCKYLPGRGGGDKMVIDRNESGCLLVVLFTLWTIFNRVYWTHAPNDLLLQITMITEVVAINGTVIF